MTESTQAKKPAPRTVNIFLGFFFLLNIQFGTGYLGIPFAFYHTGLLVGSITLLGISFITWNCAVWELEVMARAQAVFERKLQRKEYNEPIGRAAIPNFTVKLDRKFEPSELCEIFLGPLFKVIYLVVLILHGFFACLSLSTVAGSALAVNIPFNFTGLIEQCDNNDFLITFLPNNIPCRNAYWISLAAFAIIVVPLSLFELKEQLIVQVTLGIMRFVTIGGVIVFSLANFLVTDQKRCLMMCDDIWSEMKNDEECNVTSTKELATKFDGVSFLVAIPVFVFAHVCHQCIPGLTHPVKQKRYLRAYLNALYLVSAIVYLLLGVSVSLWFRQCTVETCTLNWAGYLASDNIPLKIFSYLIVLFPTFAVVSTYPLYVVTITNNMQAVIFPGKENVTSTKTAVFVRLLVKFIVTIVPILVALALSNLVEVLKYTGLMAFFLCFFPAILQLRSQWVCKKMFSARRPMPGSSKQDIILTEMANKNKDDEPIARDLYMTPYSTVFSHWPVVVIITIVGVILFSMTVVSLFIPLF